MPATGFYRWLSRLQGDKLAEFISASSVSDAACREMLREAGDPLPICDVPAEGQPGDAEADGVPDGADELEPPVMPLVLSEPLQYRRCIVEGLAGSVKVYFNHTAPTLEKQRAYANCLEATHHNCFQWRLAGDFGSRDEAARCFYCWASMHGAFKSRHEHTPFRPSAAQVATVGPVAITGW